MDFAKLVCGCLVGFSCGFRLWISCEYCLWICWWISACGFLVDFPGGLGLWISFVDFVCGFVCGFRLWISFVDFLWILFVDMLVDFLWMFAGFIVDLFVDRLWIRLWISCNCSRTAPPGDFANRENPLAPPNESTYFKCKNSLAPTTKFTVKSPPSPPPFFRKR